MPYLRRPQKIRDNTLLVRKGFQVLGWFLSGGFRLMVGAPFIRLGQNMLLVAGMISLCQRLLLHRNGGANRVEALYQ